MAHGKDLARRALDEFLTSLSNLERKVVERSPLSNEETLAYIAKAHEPRWAQNEQTYLALIETIPGERTKLRNRALQQYAEVILPKLKGGRPRKDELAAEAARLKTTGLSHREIARSLSQEYEQPVTAESIRGLLKVRRRKSRQSSFPPEKT